MVSQHTQSGSWIVVELPVWIDDYANLDISWSG
jgi:hypothetical protein